MSRSSVNYSARADIKTVQSTGSTNFTLEHQSPRSSENPPYPPAGSRQRLLQRSSGYPVSRFEREDYNLETCPDLPRQKLGLAQREALNPHQVLIRQLEIQPPNQLSIDQSLCPFYRQLLFWGIIGTFTPMRNSDQCQCLSIFGFLFLASVFRSISAANYLPTDEIFLNCGAAPQTSDSDRQWTSDIGSKFAPAAGNSLTATASAQDPSVPTVPYMTARIFKSEYTYSFPVSSGRKFVRLHFYPASYLGLNASNAIFSVVVGEYTLLKNFSAAQTTQALNYAFMMKEYSVNVPDATLNITFKPSSTPNSYAFVNGIEVVSMADIYNTADGTALVVGPATPYYIDNSTGS
ncbi:hypothetical protein HYC85_022275 [Camellia sinensis]|uniref:Malectin domain-containing protein n=1 Tax=Camellia sinensis TaxID=4442 RepID=A0A7J7GNY5_CAMSI|nr:hypothetical protein HYC85_022275 [Camellia sinensis]